MFRSAFRTPAACPYISTHRQLDQILQGQVQHVIIAAECISHLNNIDAQLQSFLQKAHCHAHVARRWLENARLCMFLSLNLSPVKLTAEQVYGYRAPFDIYRSATIALTGKELEH